MMPLDTSLVRKPFKVIGTRPPSRWHRQGHGPRQVWCDIVCAGPARRPVLRSPHAHAKIRKIDTSKAEKLRA
jgi:CO/xanthine dehydrogenase Mo-binding subunit